MYVHSVVSGTSVTATAQWKFWSALSAASQDKKQLGTEFTIPYRTKAPRLCLLSGYKLRVDNIEKHLYSPAVWKTINSK